MATKPGSVTTRRYIRRNDGEAAESTSTLVLTSPEGYFVDIRPLKESGTSSILPLPGVSRDVVEPIPGTADISRLQWAFAGRAVTTERPDGTQHCAWTHLVDSQTTAVEDEVDEGIMEIRQERGHDGNLYEWEVESGESIGPDGSKQTYEEGWLSLPVCLDLREPYRLLDQQIVRFKPAQQVTGTCIVLTTDSFLSGAIKFPLGMIIKVGDWCQGILRTSEHDLLASRWWRHKGEWQKLLTIGPKGSNDGNMEEVIKWLDLAGEKRQRGSKIPKWQGCEFFVH